MLIGVISDTHGNLTAVRQAVGKAGAVELWLHAGDFSQDAGYLAMLTGQRVIAAAGNCDGQTIAKPDEFIDAAGRKIWLTHGHRHGVQRNCRELIWWAEQFGVQIVVYGHTHISDVTWEQELLVFNPGSPVNPRAGSPPSFGLINLLTDGRIDAQIIHL